MVCACAAVAAMVSTVSAQNGPTSPYYVTAAGDQNTTTVLRGTVVVFQWAQLGLREYPIAVVDDVRTLGGSSGGIGARYALDGSDLGDRYRFPSGIGSCYDGATDGTSNYAVDFGNGGVWRFDRSWADGRMIFATAPFYLGITHDASDNTLWISAWFEDTIEHRTMDGKYLGRFTTGFTNISCLALDPADGTLWMGSQTTLGTYYQYDKAGNRLQTVTYDGFTDNTIGGEFPFSPQGATHCLYVVTKVKNKKTNECLESCDRAPYAVGDRVCGVVCNGDRDCDAKLKMFLGCANGAVALVKADLIGCRVCDSGCQ